MAEGDWRGVIFLQGQELPFNFEVQIQEGAPTITLINGEERLLIDSIIFLGDSLIAPMHIFDAEIRAKMEDKKLNGYFIKNYTKDYKLPFEAEHGIKFRFKEKGTNARVLKNKYKIHFENKPDSVFAVGVFTQKEDKLTGSVLTRTGDQRYLDGLVDNDSLFLSAFDGEHAYLYKARINSDSSLNGVYYSGKSSNTKFTAVPDDEIELPDANTITFLKPGFKKFEFSFPGLDGKPISLDDEKYKGKVVIVQLLGSWCPNCMDETKFLASWYEKNKSKAVEIIGLAYEKKDDFDYAKERLTKMKQRLNVGYDIAFAGSSEKEASSNSLPMLNAVLAFPTTIFIDKNGMVRKIHTGFSGPGTGIYYEKFVEEFNETVDKLLQE